MTSAWVVVEGLHIGASLMPELRWSVRIWVVATGSLQKGQLTIFTARTGVWQSGQGVMVRVGGKVWPLVQME